MQKGRVHLHWNHTVGYIQVCFITLHASHSRQSVRQNGYGLSTHTLAEVYRGFSFLGVLVCVGLYITSL